MSLEQIIKSRSPSGSRYSYSKTADPYARMQAEVYRTVQDYASKQRRTDEIFNQKSAWVNTSRHDLIDERTGKKVRARTVYVGEEAKNGVPFPTWDIPVLNLDRLNNVENLIENKAESASSSDIDRAAYSPYTNEFLDQVNQYYDFLKAVKSETASMTSQDFSTINNVTLTGRLINRQERQYVIQNAVTVENTTDIVFREFEVSRFEIEDETAELSTSEPKKMTFSKAEFRMGKTQAELQWSDEFLMQNYLFDPLALARQNLTSDAERVKAKKVMLLMLQLSTTAGADLTAYTASTDHSSYNPFISFAAIEQTISYDNFGNWDSIICNPKIIQYYMSNSYVKGIGQPQQVEANNTKTWTLPGLAGKTVYADHMVVDGTMYNYSKNSFFRKQGPVRTEQYRMTREGGNGMLYRDWHRVYTNYKEQGVALTSLAPP